MLTLLDEGVTPGTFQGNLSKACQDNGLPNVKYDLQSNTAQVFFEAFTGQYSTESTKTPKKIKSKTSKYSRDQLKNLGQNYSTSDSDTNVDFDHNTRRKALIDKPKSKSNFPISDSLTFSAPQDIDYPPRPPQDSRYLMPDTPLSLNTENLCHNQVSCVSNFKDDDLCNDSGKTVNPNPEYLRHLHDTFINECNKDLDSRIPTISSLSQSKVAYISDSDSDY